MDAVLKQLNGDMTQAYIARASSFLLVNGADIDTTLSNYSNMVEYLSGDGYQGVLAGSIPFSTGNPDAPGWIETAQSIEDGLASTTGVIGRTNLSSIAANFAHNLPTPTGGPTIVPWYWWAIGGVLALGWMFSQARGVGREVNIARGATAGLGWYRRRTRKKR